MREEKGRRQKEKENDSEGRSRRGRKGRRKGRRYALGLKPPNQNCCLRPCLNSTFVLADKTYETVAFTKVGRRRVFTAAVLFAT